MSRAHTVERGKRLEYLTFAWNCLEALAALLFDYIAGSIALVGFGFDSLIELTSAGVLLWRLQQDRKAGRGPGTEQMAHRLVGGCFIALALYIFYGSVSRLLAREAPHESISGIVIASASLVTMPLLARPKRKVASELGSAALGADATQTQLCVSVFSLRFDAQRAVGLVVGGPSRGLGDASVGHQGGYRGLEGQALRLPGGA